MWRAAIEMREPDGGAGATPLVEHCRWEGVQFCGVREIRTDTEWPDQVKSAQQSDVPEHLAARFVARTNRVSGAARFTLRTESVLHRCIHLPLQLQEISHVQVLGLEPAQEHVVIPALSRQMDVIVARYPVLGCSGSPV